MSDWGAGFATGIAVGLVIGLSAGRRQKPWSELSEREKKTRIGLIAAGVVLLAAGTFLQTPVPKKVLGDLRHAKQKSRIMEWQSRWPSTGAVRNFAHFWRLPGFHNRIRFLWHTLLPTREYMLNRYRPKHYHSWPLLYPYRWSIILQDMTKTIGEIWRQSRIR